MNATQETPPTSYSTAEVARRLGVSTPTVQRWVDAGVLRAWKTVGGHRRIDGQSLDVFLAELADGRHSSVTRATPSASGITVLIVDDNPNDRDILSAIVETALPEARIRLAENGFQALQLIGQIQPDIVITDIVMPNLNGFEMLRHIASETDAAERLILAVSSHSPQQFAKLGVLPSTVKFFPKPIDPAALTDALQSVHQRRGASHRS